VIGSFQSARHGVIFKKALTALRLDRSCGLMLVRLAPDFYDGWYFSVELRRRTA
jgi:hypothetical protein